MALTYSEMVPLGQNAPDFSLPGIDGKQHSLKTFRGKKGIVVLFICQHCPYVQAVEDRIAKLAKEFAPKSIQFIAINSNDIKKYPEDSPEKMKEQALRAGFDFPYLVDETQEIARAYGAVCTPDIFVFDHDFKLRYRGRIDDNWKEPKKVTRQELREALSALVENKLISEKQNPSMGCSIKWRG